MYLNARELADLHHDDLIAFQGKLVTAAELKKFAGKEDQYFGGPWNYLLQPQLRDFLTEFGDTGAEALAVLCRFRAFLGNAQVGTHPKDDRDYTGSPELEATARALRQFAETCRALDLARNPEEIPTAIERIAPRFAEPLPQQDGAREAAESIRKQFQVPPDQTAMLPWRARFQMEDFLAEFGKLSIGALERISTDRRFWTEIEHARGSDFTNSQGEDQGGAHEASYQHGEYDLYALQDMHMNTAGWYMAELTAIARMMELSRYPALASEVASRMVFRAYPLASGQLGYECSDMITTFAAENGLGTALELVSRVLSARPWLVYVNAPENEAAVRAERFAVLKVGCNAWYATSGREAPQRVAAAELAMAGALAHDLRNPDGKPRSESGRMDAGHYIVFLSLIALVGWFAWLITAPLR